MKSLVNPTNNAGRTCGVWSFESVASAHVQSMLVGLREDVTSMIESMDGMSEQAVTSAVTNVVYWFEYSVNTDTSLSQAEKDSLAGAITILYAQVGNIVHDYIYTYNIPTDQGRTQANFWKKFGRIAGSIVLCMVVGAVACGLVGVALLAAGSASALTLPATITIAGINFGVASLSMAIGGAAGLAVGGAMAAGDVCVCVCVC